MRESNLIERWADPGFLQQIAPVLSIVFVEKTTSAAVDFRGVIIGLDGAPSQLLHADFLHFRGNEIDLSHCKASCAFNHAQFSKSKFIASMLDTCRFKDSHFDSCSFDQANFKSPTLDDSRFRDCSFVGAKITGREMQGYGGRRAIFERCDFRQAVFRNLQLRACAFRKCRFDSASFVKCIMAGVKFDGERPLDERLIDCSG